MPHFRDALERAQYLVREGLAVDLRTALMIEEAEEDGSDRKSSNNTDRSEK